MRKQTREEHLQELGYEEPFDSSPVDIPDGWVGGEVVNTGGGVFVDYGEHGREVVLHAKLSTK